MPEGLRQRDQKAKIEADADRCGLTVSTYLVALGMGYEPKARMTPTECDLIDHLSHASDDYADYLAHCKARREMPEESLKALGLKPLPTPAVETQPIVAQRQSLAALHDWHTHLSHIHRNFLIYLLIAIAAPPLLTLWLSLFPTKK
ncbi:MAG: hypothetical protein LIP02_14570 [Bacteroidales bacterium]|nr:hypothetical protein [Bacteroidales bacterium]